MRYALAAAAFAAGAIAVPFNNDKRAVVTDIDIVYETTYVTVTAGDEPAPAAPTTTTTTAHNYHYAHKHSWSKVWTSTTADTSVYVPPASTQAPAPTTEAPASTYEAPAPTTEAPASTTEAPAPASTTEAPASTYVAPTTDAALYSSAAPSASASGYGSVSAPDDYAKKAVYHHNLHRANHSSPDLEWDAGLASTAATIAASCVYAHDVTTNGGGYGQNIAAGVAPDNITAIITDLFYNGEVGYFDGLYGQAQPSMDNFEKWGHFSQIVWKGTTHVGCATQDCSSKGLANVGSNVAAYFTVCNYKSPGNYANEYADNVGASKKMATVGWNAGL